jgi:hypothetical protein
MTKDGVVVDTSVWIAFFRDKQPIASKLTDLIENHQAFLTGVVLAEILQGIKNTREEKRILEAVLGVPDLEISNHVWAKTGQMSALLRRKGINIPLTDAALAVLCFEHSFSLFTLDKHFEGISGVKLCISNREVP